MLLRATRGLLVGAVYYVRYTENGWQLGASAPGTLSGPQFFQGFNSFSNIILK